MMKTWTFAKSVKGNLSPSYKILSRVDSRENDWILNVNICDHTLLLLC